MDIRLLCIGDVVGTPGRRMVQKFVPELVEQHKIDCVIVNAENTASGSGLTPDLYEKICAAGADLITLGDHIYRRSNIIPVLEKGTNIVRPANLPKQAPGKDFAIAVAATGHRVAVVSVMGRMFMKMPVDCPYQTVDRVLGAIPNDVKIIVIDVHAEATSEKVAMGWYVDGRASVVFGTHTHVPTADEAVLPRGTAYITDVGMTGPYDSVLGRMKDRVLSAMITGVPAKFDVAAGDPRLSGVLVTVDSNTGKAKAIERVSCRGTAPDVP